MKIEAKHIMFVGAFIVLTIVGYNVLPKDEIIINSETYLDSSNSYCSGSDIVESIYVHIEGAVNNPGIKKVPVGTRVFELIQMASGELLDADISKINLASIVKDEQKIYVPFKVIENTDVTTNSGYNQNANNNQNVTKDSQNVSINNNSILVNINTASSEELQKLEGIGPSMAQKIINYRLEIGYFMAIEDIKKVSGIGESKFDKIKDNITI
ncbi:MAG: helix-hairpin-helix domain-containing protein [Clostridia bacterium]|nr:helix-hairpin-helix domain-containing protein [Clostridia bacterium]